MIYFRIKADELLVWHLFYGYPHFTTNFFCIVHQYVYDFCAILERKRLTKCKILYILYLKGLKKVVFRTFLL